MIEDLKLKTISGLKWSSVSQITRQVFQYITTIILVGLLSPKDFGLMAMAIIIIGFLDIFKDLGTGSALIQKVNLSDSLISSLFWINISFGAIITAILFFAAPYIAEFYGSESITGILQVLSISFLIAGFSIVQKTLLEKDLSFKKLSIIELISVTGSSFVGIFLAFSGYGVWSLVFQSLSNVVMNSLLLFVFTKWIPSFYFNLNEVKTLSSYSLYLIGFNTINYFSRNADYFIIGKFLGDTALGHYYLAYRIMLYPIQNITTVVSRVIFPSFSKIQNDNKKFRNAYINIANSIAIITFPIMTGMAFLSGEFATVFFGERWDTQLVSLLILILAPVGALQSIVSTVGNIYLAKGKTDWMFKWSIFSGIITITGFFIGLRWGTVGVALSYLITNLLLIYPVFNIPFKLIDLSSVLFFRTFNNVLITILLMLISLFVLSYFLNDITNFLRLIVLSISGMLVYIFFSLKLNKKFIGNLKLLIGKNNNSF